MEQSEYINGLLEFLGASPTPFHAVAAGVRQLEAHGFTGLSEENPWQDLPAGRYFVTRNDSSLIAFTWSGRNKAARLHCVGAHTDSPCLKLKPNPVQENSGCLQLGAEVYGGALLGPWFDRDLSLAGRVCLRDGDRLRTVLVDFRRPMAIIPSLAIHLDREANKKKEINKQTDLVPLAGLPGDGREGFLKILQQEVMAGHAELTDPEISDFDLFFYDTAPPSLIGLDRELLSSARLDNLVSCAAALQALVQPDTADNSFIILNDHEEVGSVSTVGAQGPFLLDVLERLLPEVEQRKTVLRRSLLISADNAHGVHPNFAAKHDPQHQPRMEQGPVIKFNANQRYATNAQTAARFRLLCSRAQVPVQEFVMRNDMACGSTIGPLTAAEIGLDTVDVGIPSLAMHSIRETAACRDCWYLYKVLTQFFCRQQD